jgi:hypothetical protein
MPYFFFFFFAFSFVQTSLSSPPCFICSLQFPSFEFCHYRHLASTYLGLVFRSRSLWIASILFLTFGFVLLLCDIFVFMFHFLHSCFYSEFLNMFLSCVFAMCNLMSLLFVFICTLQEQRSVKQKQIVLWKLALKNSARILTIATSTQQEKLHTQLD